MFISWVPSPPLHLNINFDDNVKDSQGGAGFVIQGPGLGLLVTGKSYLFEPMVPIVELHGAWGGVAYAWMIL